MQNHFDFHLILNGPLFVQRFVLYSLRASLAVGFAYSRVILSLGASAYTCQHTIVGIHESAKSKSQLKSQLHSRLAPWQYFMHFAHKWL